MPGGHANPPNGVARPPGPFVAGESGSLGAAAAPMLDKTATFSTQGALFGTPLDRTATFSTGFVSLARPRKRKYQVDEPLPWLGALRQAVTGQENRDLVHRNLPNRKCDEKWCTRGEGACPLPPSRGPAGLESSLDLGDEERTGR